MAKRPCAYTATDNHSTDRVEIWHGSPEPLVLCGYHAQPIVSGSHDAAARRFAELKGMAQ